MKITKTLLFAFAFLSILVTGISTAYSADNTMAEANVYKAEVIEILEERNKSREDGSVYVQQNILLQIIDADREMEQVEYHGISDIEVVSMNYYRTGDKVYIDSYIDFDGDEVFYIVDNVRSGALLILVIIFLVVVIAVARLKGLRAILSLLLSFIVIIKFIIPQVIAGNDPFLISLIGGLLIMTIIIYLTEGWSRKSHLSIISVFFSLIITLLLSVLFVNLTNISGFGQDEVAYLIGVGNLDINFKGLLLAGFIIGAIGVLDDIVVGQIESTESLRKANPNLSKLEIFKLSYRIGNTHLGAIVNTLFLTYTGAALPLLLLFVLNQAAGLSIERFISTEAVATEVVRTLVGSIGVIISMPIATFLGSYFGKSDK